MNSCERFGTFMKSGHLFLVKFGLKQIMQKWYGAVQYHLWRLVEFSNKDGKLLLETGDS